MECMTCPMITVWVVLINPLSNWNSARSNRRLWGSREKRRWNVDRKKLNLRLSVSMTQCSMLLTSKSMIKSLLNSNLRNSKKLRWPPWRLHRRDKHIYRKEPKLDLRKERNMVGTCLLEAICPLTEICTHQSLSIPLANKDKNGDTNAFLWGMMSVMKAINPGTMMLL